METKLLAHEKYIRYLFIGRDVAQSGRAQRSGRWGRWFESSRPDHFKIFSSDPSTMNNASIKRSFKHHIKSPLKRANGLFYDYQSQS